MFITNFTHDIHLNNNPNTYRVANTFYLCKPFNDVTGLDHETNQVHLPVNS